MKLINSKAPKTQKVETAIELIGSTTTKTGLKVICQRDENIYELSIAVSDEDFESINT